MKLRLIPFMYSCALFGQSLFAANFQSHVTARLSPTAASDGVSKIYVYSPSPLSSVRYNLPESERWHYMTSLGRQQNLHVYATPTIKVPEAGSLIRVAGVTSSNVEIVDALTIQEDTSIKVAGVSEVKLKTPPKPAFVLDQRTIYYGSPYIDPQTLAQARANEMARTNTMQHFGGGGVMTTVGMLYEGIGMGGWNCHTCTAVNGTPAIGDGQAMGSNGMVYRSRLYNSPGTTSGGSGGGRRRR